MRNVIGIVTALVAAVVVLGSTVLAAPEIADSAFKRVWDRQDLLIENQQVKDRSWTWGPNVSGALEEDLKQGVNGKRRVQYFEKSRMEINDPNADANSQWYVTNGLLPVEMMTGKVQTGYDFGTEYRQRGPATIPAIGDRQNSFPTYKDLLTIYASPGSVRASDLNKPVTQMLNPDLSTTTFDTYADDPMHMGATTLIQGDNGHGIVQAFADFMNQEGFVYEGGRPVRGKVFAPLFVFGYPVTEPYWVNVQVGGQDMPILFQVFERRVLTYNPANDLAFRVEMGNVGLHYYEWRYGELPDNGGGGGGGDTEPTPTPEPGGYPAP